MQKYHTDISENLGAYLYLPDKCSRFKDTYHATIDSIWTVIDP